MLRWLECALDPNKTATVETQKGSAGQWSDVVRPPFYERFFRIRNTQTHTQTRTHNKHVNCLFLFRARNTTQQRQANNLARTHARTPCCFVRRGNLLFFGYCCGSCCGNCPLHIRQVCSRVCCQAQGRLSIHSSCLFARLLSPRSLVDAANTQPLPGCNGTERSQDVAFLRSHAFPLLFTLELFFFSLFAEFFKSSCSGR